MLTRADVIIARNIRARRMVLGLTIIEVKKRSGVGRVDHIESASLRLDVKSMLCLCRVLQMNITDVYAGLYETTPARRRTS